jgi:V8-like Glu-specific endopeptidase
LATLALSPLQKGEARVVVPDNGVDVIYGLDDRYEVDDYKDQRFVKLANAVATRISKKRLTIDRENPERILFPKTTLKNNMPEICLDEKFIDQRTPGDCSGFLVGPKTLVTAGHCMMNEKECADFRWVFGYKLGVEEFKSSQVYTCKKIISQKFYYTEKEVNDYAVIELDRNVINASPLKYRKHGLVLQGSRLLTIGHPLGLPMKITDGAKVSRMNKEEREHPIRSWFMKANYFTTNLDAYAGNSGAPVLNIKTGKVEGILIQGADDFVYNDERKCIESRKLSNHYLNTYEKVMRINKVPGL